MSKTNYDIFISYRREGGGATAGRINDMLTTDGYSVSYDVGTLREGRFDKQLLERVEQCQDFILVVDKNCFARTIDPTTDKQDDWLWQELSYALQLKKNIIPVLLAGAEFPKRLPKDIDSVRSINSPKCIHEYFDEFYKRLRDDFLRAYPRLAKPSYVGPASPMKIMACLKLKADIDCIFYLDGEEFSHLKAGIIQKIPLAKGEYELTFVSEENGKDQLEMDLVMPDVDKLQKVNLSVIRNARLQKEAEAKRIAKEKRQAKEKRKKEEAEERRIAEEQKRAKEMTFTVGKVSFKMIRVDGGTFTMGATSEQGSEAQSNEKPTHQVTLSTFFIGETEVTQELWEAVMGRNPSFFKGAQRPVENVSWNDCETFISKLNSKTGKSFRLPTEAEWEFAARGGNKSQGYKYSGGNALDSVVWYKENSAGETHPVKTKYPNELGLYDMSGNVKEWCQDWYGKYASSTQSNPTGPSSGSNRVFRGGSWLSLASDCRVALRYYNSPTVTVSHLGLRLAL